MLLTTILFIVSVPVLSEHMHEVEPNVSTDYKFFTKTCFSASFLAVIASEMVTQARIPQGTLATMIPIPKRAQSRYEYPMTNLPTTMKITPSEQAMMVMRSTKQSISIWSGDFCYLPFCEISATEPRQVCAPMLMTMPRPRPILQYVPKRATFFAYSRLSLVSSGTLSRRVVSPVMEELSTCMSLEWTILRSAGIRSPSASSTRSPLTSLPAGSFSSCPSLMTVQSEGNISLNFAMISCDLAVCMQVMTPVIRMTATNESARQRLASLPKGWIMYMPVERMAPIQRRMANQLVISFRKRMMGWIFQGSGNLLSPQSLFRWIARALVMPLLLSVSRVRSISASGTQ